MLGPQFKLPCIVIPFVASAQKKSIEVEDFILENKI
jgi:hypothetical protein